MDKNLYTSCHSKPANNWLVTLSANDCVRSAKAGRQIWYYDQYHSAIWTGPYTSTIGSL